MSTLPLIGITMGDPAGIGGEIILKALQKISVESICNAIVIGDSSYLTYLIEKFSLPVEITVIDRIERKNFPYSSHTIPLVDLKNMKTLPMKEFGKCCVSYGEATYQYIMKGIELVSSGSIDALVTAPINKQGLAKAGIPYSGHTEILAHFTGSSRFAMMLVGGILRVVLVTRHIPFKAVSKNLSEKKVLIAIELAHEAGVYFDIPKPKIGICGLNPHSGEDGRVGDEETKILIPAIKKALRRGIDVTGPHPSDTVFYKVLKGEYDFIIALYHDQGLIPLKMLYFDRGVNVTLGLPFIRTSPVHGTAYEIAGKGIANSRSMEEAIKLAGGMTQLQRRFKNTAEN